MGLSDKPAPVLLKPSSNHEFIQQLSDCLETVDDQLRSQLERDISLFKAGDYGEQQVLFELTHSSLPIVIAADVYFEFQDQHVQVDFMVFTPKMCFVIECKNLVGDIKVTSNGEFQRTYRVKNRVYKEAMYSPVTQNKRHIDFLETMRYQKKSIFHKVLDKVIAPPAYYQSLVVLANSKSNLDVKYAPGAIKNHVIRLDQLVETIRRIYNGSFLAKSTWKETLAWADSFDYSKVNDNSALLAKYRGEAETPKYSIEALEQALKAYRLQKCRNDKIKAYLIFNNQQMGELLIQRPDSLETLERCGISSASIKRYGAEILAIIKGS